MSAVIGTGGKCTQAGCPVAKTGECLNGLAIGKCPSYSGVGSAGETGDVAPSPVGRMEEAPQGVPGMPVLPAKPATTQARDRRGWISFSTGDALVPAEVAGIRAASLPRLVVLAGPPKAGKTTIVTSIYEALVFGELQGHLFSGSATLPGFEQRCFLNRPESGLEFPETEHTQPSAEPRFLHLRTASVGELGIHTDILFGDISGEDFESIRNNRGAIERMPYLMLMDHLAIVIDGEALCSPGERDSAEMDSSQLVQRFVESTHISRDCCVHVVVSKMDLVEHVGGPTALSFAQALSRTLGDAARKRFDNVACHFVAARPTKYQPKAGKQLDTLYSSWVSYCRPLPRLEGV